MGGPIYTNNRPGSSGSYSNKGYGGGSSSYGSKSKGINTAAKVAGAYVGYKVARKGIKYGSYGGGWTNSYYYPRPTSFYHRPVYVPVGRYQDRYYDRVYDRDSESIEKNCQRLNS